MPELWFLSDDVPDLTPAVYDEIKALGLFRQKKRAAAVLLEVAQRLRAPEGARQEAASVAKAAFGLAGRHRRFGREHEALVAAAAGVVLSKIAGL